MPKAITVSTFNREAGELKWECSSVVRPSDLFRPWEPENMVSAATNSFGTSVLINVDSVETSMMAKLSLEEAIALRKELN